MDDFTEGSEWHPDDVGKGNGWKVPNVPHAASYGASLPLRPTRSTALTAAERKVLNARRAPVRLFTRDLTIVVEMAQRDVRDNKRGAKWHVWAADALVKRRDHIRAKAAELNFQVIEC